MKISIKKSTFGIHWNHLKLSKHKLSSLKMKNLHLNSESLSELENSETEFSINNPLKRWKLIFSHCRRFQLTIFLSHATTLAGIFRKLVALLHNFFNSTGLQQFNVLFSSFFPVWTNILKWCSISVINRVNYVLLK